MRISPITGYNHVAPLKPKQNLKNITFTNAQTTPLTKDDFKCADEYCKTRSEELKNLAQDVSYPRFSLLRNFDLNKLNGIQYGIDLFDGMTMKEVAVVLHNTNILLNRGCNNLCSHCFVNALPPQQLNGVKSFTYEDFEKLIKGISELKSRVEKYGCKMSNFNIEELFLDSDCINVEIKDKNNKTYDIMDCFDLLSKYSIATRGYFDTSGWTPTSVKHQKRAEKLVKYIQDTYKDNTIRYKPITDVLVSINPFHSIYQKYLDLKDSNPEKAKKYRDLYINRMANVLYTFSPLLDIKNLAYSLNLTVLNSNSNYDYKVMDKLIEDIFNRLDKIYDAKGVDSELKEHYLYKYRKELNGFKRETLGAYRSIAPCGRAADIMPNYKDRQDRILIQEKNKSLILRPSKIDKSDTAIEPNGEVKIMYNYTFFPTDIQLNFNQKDEITPPLGDEVLGEKIKPNDEIFLINNSFGFSTYVYEHFLN